MGPNLKIVVQDPSFSHFKHRTYFLQFSKQSHWSCSNKEAILFHGAREVAIEVSSFWKFAGFTGVPALDYIKESDNLVSLHDQFRDCDRSRMETLLSGFQAEIDSISSDIRILQEKYMDMSLILKNRKLFGLVILCKLDEEGDDPSGEALDAETNNEKLEVSVQGYLQGYE
ncbi:uncharacterized protein LOC108343869 isoform X2 [Vigna angularis]|uniref:uncharacterized protein LOC108343869 isoform X2 n=1 Tax=Phaseolus angularis TaxID=3914 RepID=UPI0022B5DAAE|nr:uncharacterized protein LOC108343869 isoform X2 [Vigna angularis]